MQSRYLLTQSGRCQWSMEEKISEKECFESEAKNKGVIGGEKVRMRLIIIIIIMWQAPPGASPFPQCRAIDLDRTLCASEDEAGKLI